MVKAVLDDWFPIFDAPRVPMVERTIPATQDGL
jgi:hypothetical protein